MKISISDFWLVVGYHCNNRCQHCYAKTLCTQPRGQWMSLAYARNIMSMMKEGGAKNCLLIGGEPSLMPDLEKIISYGSNLGLKMIIITNGRRFKDEKFAQRLFDLGLSQVTVSLASHKEILHDTWTQKTGSFRETCQGIENCARFGYISTITLNYETPSQQKNSQQHKTNRLNKQSVLIQKI